MITYAFPTLVNYNKSRLCCLFVFFVQCDLKKNVNYNFFCVNLKEKLIKQTVDFFRPK